MSHTVEQMDNEPGPGDFTETSSGTWIDETGGHYDPFTDEESTAGAEFIFRPGHEPDDLDKPEPSIEEEMKQLLKEQEEAKEQKDEEGFQQSLATDEVEVTGMEDEQVQDETNSGDGEYLMKDGEVV